LFLISFKAKFLFVVIVKLHTTKYISKQEPSIKKFKKRWIFW